MPELLCYVVLFYFAVAVARMLASRCRSNAKELCYTAELIGAELFFPPQKNLILPKLRGRDSSVGMATRYGLDGL